MSEFNGALFDSSLADGLEEPSISGINPFVRTKLDAMEEEIVNLESRLTEILDQNREMVRLLREMAGFQAPSVPDKNPFGDDGSSDDGN